ncbi:hypothetical protein CFP56_038987, partial [Quercus suber]
MFQENFVTSCGKLARILYLQSKINNSPCAVKASSGNYANLVNLIKTQLHLLDLFFVIFWLLWNQRNKIQVGDSGPPM